MTQRGRHSGCRMTGWLRLLLCSCALFGLATRASAQTHECDQAELTTQQVRRNDSGPVAFCHDLVDDSGTAIPLGAVRYRLVNASTGAVIADLGLLQPSGPPNTGGEYPFRSTQTYSFASDTTIAVTAEYNGVVVPSQSLVIDVRGGPKVPSGLRIVISQ